MNILDKFNAVEVKADSRISDYERQFCEDNQAAYDKARKALKHMAEELIRYSEEQSALMKKYSSACVVDSYLYDMSRTKYYSASEFYSALADSHDRFIRNIVHFFASRHNVSLESSDISDALLPKKPSSYGWSYNEKEHMEYNKKLQEMRVDYHDILDQIFIALGGVTFQEKAIQEIKDACHKGAWNMYHGTREYEQKKAVISFGKYKCSYENWLGNEHWNLDDDMKNIVRAFPLFESGISDGGHTRFDTLLDYRFNVPYFEFSGEKIKSLKCFKNGRVDVRFASEAVAREFVEDYLGLEV